MNKIRRINLFSGPGAGKSVVAAQLFAELKKVNINIEHVQEYIKVQALQKRFPESFEQFHIFAHQMHREDRLLPHVDCIVTDSPLLLNAVYTKYYKAPFWEQCLEVAQMFEEKYPSLNIFLDRKDLIYQQIGRYQDLGKAIEIDQKILSLLNQNNIDYELIKTNDFDRILMVAKNRLSVGV